MPINPAYAITVGAGVPYYRITSRFFWTAGKKEHSRVVNGDGSKRNLPGGRYNYPAQVSVYLTETIGSCLAEKMFYFHRDVLRSLDLMHILTGPVPPLELDCVIWEIKFKAAVAGVCDLTPANALGIGVMQSLMLNPSQDYYHLKDRRSYLEVNGYSGLRSPSSRCTAGGKMVVLFSDQSKNIASIEPFEAKFRLLQQVPPNPAQPFTNHATQLLDFYSGEVQIVGSPSGIKTYDNFTPVKFNH